MYTQLFHMNQPDCSTADKPISSKMSEYIRNYIKTQSNPNPKDHPDTADQQTNHQDFRFEYQENVSEKGQVVKKKRGRPKKNDQKPPTTEGKHKRGRKKKQHQETPQQDSSKSDLLGSRSILKRQNTPDHDKDQKTVSIYKKKRGRPSSKQPAISELQISEDESEEGGRKEEQRKRGRPPKSKQTERSLKAPSKRFINKWKQSEGPTAQIRLMSKIRDKLSISRKEKEGEINSVETQEKESEMHSQRNSDSEPYFQILQIKKRSKDIHYLVQIGQSIRWATKEDLIDEYAIELVKFYEERLLAQSIKDGRPILMKGSESRNLYMKYQ